MSSMCGYPGDREAAVIAYVYDEETPAERAAFEAHLASCAQCRGEIDAIEGVRGQLAHWSPPDFAAAFNRAEAAATAGGARFGWRDLPAWAQVAAAMLVLGVSAGVANLDVHYDGQRGLDVRTGWSRPNASASETTAATSTSAPQAKREALRPAAAPDGTASSNAPWRAELAALEQQLRGEMHASAGAGGPAAGRASSSNDADMMRRVKSLVDESEKRQQRELALRVTALLQDLNAQRQADLRKIDQNLGLIQDRTGVEVLRNRQMIDYYIQRASQRR